MQDESFESRKTKVNKTCKVNTITRQETICIPKVISNDISGRITFGKWIEFGHNELNKSTEIDTYEIPRARKNSW